MKNIRFFVFFTEFFCKCILFFILLKANWLICTNFIEWKKQKNTLSRDILKLDCYAQCHKIFRVVVNSTLTDVESIVCK